MFDRLPKASVSDAVIAGAWAEELDRQCYQIALIAWENVFSASVLAAQGSILTDKYAEGYPGKRRHDGCELAGKVEAVAMKRLK